MVHISPGVTYTIVTDDARFLTQASGPFGVDELLLESRPLPDYAGQHWKAELTNQGIAFRNLGNQKLLNAASDGTLDVSATDLTDNDRFLVNDTGPHGASLVLERYGRTQYVAKKEDSNHLSLSEYDSDRVTFGFIEER